MSTDVEQALQLAKRCGDASTHAHVLQFAGAALLHCRSIDAGYHLFQQNVEVCEANDLTFHLPAAYGGAQAWLAWSGQLDQTRRHARRTIELSRQVGRPGWEAVGLTGLAAAAVLQGRPHPSAELAVGGTGGPPTTGPRDPLRHWLRHWQSLWAYASDDLESARATAEEIVRTGRGGGSRLDEAIGEWLLGMVARSQNRRDEARAHLRACRALSTDSWLPQTLGRSLLGLAELARENEDLDEAWELAHESLEVLHDYGDRVGAAAALELVADFAVALGEPDRALRLLAASQRFHIDTGIARFPSQADRFDRARTTAHAGLDPTAATSCWDAGGELSLADAVAYARRGRGERRRPQIGWASLTPAERDVVRPVAEGHTNAEIGRHLFISANTVKKHLSHVESIGEPVGLVGLSGGASWALAVAAQSDAVDAVAPYEPVANSVMDEQEQAALGEAIARAGELAAEGDLTAAARAFAAYPCTAGEIDVVEDAGYLKATARYVPDLLDFFQQFTEYEGPMPDDPAVLGAISAPVLLLHGSDTKPVFTASARHVADHIRGARVQEIPAAGHVAPLTHPEALAEALTEFFAPARQPA